MKKWWIRRKERGREEGDVGEEVEEKRRKSLRKRKTIRTEEGKCQGRGEKVGEQSMTYIVYTVNTI